MQVSFRESFLKDIKNCADKSIKQALAAIISEVELAESLTEIKNLKKLKGFKTAYRIRLKNYRVGLDCSASKVEFVRFLHRKDIYRYFP